MDFKIERIDINNYSLFDDMVYWRENGLKENIQKHQFQNK